MSPTEQELATLRMKYNNLLRDKQLADCKVERYEFEEYHRGNRQPFRQPWLMPLLKRVFACWQMTAITNAAMLLVCMLILWRAGTQYTNARVTYDQQLEDHRNHIWPAPDREMPRRHVPVVQDSDDDK